MANSLVSGLFGAASLKVLNEVTTYPVWTKLKVMKVEISNSAATTDDPISIEQITDNSTYQALVEEDIKNIKIIRPTRIRITGICPDISSLESVLTAFAAVKDTFTITSKQIISESMAVTTLDVEQSGENTSSMKIVVELEQAAPSAVDGYDPFQSADESTYGVRIQTPTSLTTSVKNLYSKVSTYIGGLL